MKTRQGFVSNSSSCNYTLVLKEGTNIKDVVYELFEGLTWCTAFQNMDDFQKKVEEEGEEYEDLYEEYEDLLEHVKEDHPVLRFNIEYGSVDSGIDDVIKRLKESGVIIESESD